MPFYNPSKLVTDVLSKYLEFDREQLKLGIWSGKLSMEDVELRRDAIYPLLNDGSNLSAQNGRPPLNLKLVKGTIGQLKIRIPWKRLVWGQGDVKLQISDVTIAVAYESREETAARNIPKEQESKAQEKEEAEEDEEEKKKKRDMKQEWLREAERCSLTGKPFPSKEEVQEEEDNNAADGQASGTASKGRLDSWLKSTTESFAWRFVAGLDASIRNVRVVIVQDGVEIGTIFHSMDIVPKTLDNKNPPEEDQLDMDLSVEDPVDPSMATPPPDVVPEGEYDDGEHLDKIVKLQGFGVFVRQENKRSKSPKTLRFSTSVSADDYILRPTEGNLSISIFDPYPAGKQKKKKVPAIEEEPTTPTTATDTVDSVASSKTRRSKREKRPLALEGESRTSPTSDAPGSTSGDSDRPAKQLRPALKRPDRISSSTRQFSISETPTPTSGNRPKAHTVDMSGGTGGEHTRTKTTISRAKLRRVTSAGQKSRVSNASVSGRSIPLLPMDDASTKDPMRPEGIGAMPPPSLDLHLSFGDVTTMFSSRHYQLALTFKSTVERMKNGRPDKTIASCFGDLGPDKKRSVFVDAPTSAVKNIDDPAITSQIPSGVLHPSLRPSGLKRAQTTGGVDFSESGGTPQRVKLQLQLELPSSRDENNKVLRSWWQYAYSTALYEVRQRRAEESTFDGRHLQFDWEKQKYKRREYVDLYIATRLEPSSVLRSMELKVKLGTKSPEEALLKIEDELPVEQILLYRSIARSMRVQGIKTMPDSVLDLHGDDWLKATSRTQRKADWSKDTMASPPGSPVPDSVSAGSNSLKGEFAEAVRDASCLAEVEPDCTDIHGMRREADAVRMRTASVTGTVLSRKGNLKRLLREDIDKNLANERRKIDQGSQTATGRVSSSRGASKLKDDVESTRKGGNVDSRTVRTFKTAKTSASATSGVNKKDSSSGNLQISASITFSNVELMLYQESTITGDSSNDSMRFRPAYSGLPSSGLDMQIRSGMQVFTHDESSSNVSDVSILSDDQKFFDQNDDISSMENAESLGDAPIMSSADFLMFGLPRDVLLHVTFSGMEGKTRGRSGGRQIVSLAVDSVSIDGDNDSHLLSMKPTSAEPSRPLDEVHVEKQKTPSKKGTAVSFTELDVLQEQALLVSVVVSKEMGSQVQCDLSKTLVTCNLDAYMNIYDFFAKVQVDFPRPLIEPTQIEELRHYVLQRLATVKEEWSNTLIGVSSALRLHGLELAVPGPVYDSSFSSEGASSALDSAVPNDTRAQVTLSLNLVEYYDGLLFQDILSLSTYYADVGSRVTNDVPLSSNDKGWRKRNLNMANVAKLVDGHHPPSSRHSVVSATGIECSASMKSDAAVKLLELPVDVEFLVTQNYPTDFLEPRPSKEISVEVSPVRFLMSENRVDILSTVALSLSGRNATTTGSTAKTCVDRLPRLAALSIQILFALELRLSCLTLTCVKDSVDIQPSQSVREIIMEESLSDFVSVLSCFNMDYPTKETVEAAGSICVDRLVVLGLSEDDAHDCVHAARLNFLAGIETMKQSQSQVIKELAEASQKFSPRGGEMPAVDVDSFSDSVPSVNEISDDDSKESLDIIEATLKGAVERTMASFGSLLQNSHPDSRAFSELLVIDLPAGANLSMTKTFYDFRLESHFRYLNVRNASGSHLVSFKCPDTYKPPKTGNDIHSSTAAGDSWAEDDGSSAVSFSFFNLDSEYNFGEGGLPLAILGSHEVSSSTGEPRQREQLVHLVVGQMELFFCQEIVDQAVQTVSQLMKSAQSHAGVNGGKGDMDEGVPQEEAVQSALFVTASSFTVLLASDELVPFCRIDAKDCTIDNALESDVSKKRPRVNVVAASLRLVDLTPEGYGYPEILYPLAQRKMENVALRPSFSLHFYPSPDKWREPKRLDIELCGMRLFVVRRFLNEMSQYGVSRNYGLGLLLDKFGFWNPDFDVKGNPPPLFQYQVSVVDSSLILPRCSTNIDMVALEVERITLFNGAAVSSFTMPTATSELVMTPNVVYGRESNRSLKTHVSNTSASDIEFFDCVDSSDTFDQERSVELSSFKKGWIKRTTILLEGFRLLTSLPSGSLCNGSTEDPLVHKFYCLRGRAVQNGPVYTRRKAIDGPSQQAEVCKKPVRFWREITTSKCSLEVIADSVPHLRLLITDRIIRRENGRAILPLNLDIRLSDLCLILSVWYSNMQELPVMFPYTPAVVEAAARATQPSVKVPEYGTDEYVQRLKSPSAMKSEIALIVDALNIQGSFDESGYFAEDPRSLQVSIPNRGKRGKRTRRGLLPFKVALSGTVFHMTSDSDGILRLACGSSSFEVVDERRNSEFGTVLVARDCISEVCQDFSGEDDEPQINDKVPHAVEKSWADLSWGLGCSGRTLGGVLSQPFQVSLFMTPGWCMTNLGFERADAIMTDFSPIWIMVDFFASYFSSAAYGNPVFEVEERKNELKYDLGDNAVNDDPGTEKKSSLNMDLRLWLLHPSICIPDSLTVSAAPSLSIECSTGFWYHYRSIESCSLQEMGSTDLSLRYSEEFHEPSLCRNTSTKRDARTLIEGLSFGLRMSFNSESQHTDYVFRMPMYDPQLHDDLAMCSVAAPEYDLKPIALPTPAVCVPFVEPAREMGPIISEVTLFLEVLPMTSSLLKKLVSTDTSSASEVATELASEALSTNSNAEDGESSFSLVAHVDSFRMFAVDPVLEKHLPIASFCISPLELNVSKMGMGGDNESIASGEAFPEDLQVTTKFLLWADYFKLGATRSWEPFLEPFRCLVLYERSKRRGHGLSLNSDDAFHLNLTGSLLVTLDENISSFSRAFSETFGDKEKPGSHQTGQDTVAPRDIIPGACIDDQLHTDQGPTLAVRHQIPKPIPSDGRTAFSFRNLTGQKIRIHQLMGPGYSSTSIVAYLDHHETTTLSFDATISVIRNLTIVEVPFPGLQNSERIDRGVSLVDHEVDIQVPGFRWLAGISVNTSGRKFDSLVPVSPSVLEKVQQDWRLRNVMKILTEVGVENGGRLIAARSIFEVRNKTSHSVFLNINPDPTQYPCVQTPFQGPTDNDRLLDPGASFQIPSLLLEASLELEGHHLGCFWIRPNDSKDNKDLSYLSVCEEKGRESAVEFSSRPIQLAKLVHESALIFKSNGGDDLEPEKVNSGVQVSCPVSASSEGAPLAPFCYVIEVRRSPLVKSTERPGSDAPPVTTPKQEKNTPLQFKGGKGAERGVVSNLRAREDRSQFMHGPVSYSLLVHPPLVIENLLPKRGRFELMHATRRTVLWFGDLNPGDRIPIHTVGLDAPLLLMVNLGFCRTPVGEGALVHHGSDAMHAKGLYNISHGGLKSFGKAVTKGTKQLGKAVTAIAESPDKRGQGKLFLVQNPQFAFKKSSSKTRKTRADVHVEGNPLGVDTGMGAADGKVYGIEHEYFDPADVVDETVVVDSVGQRLTLKIDNNRGGGGQRRISLYCPLWIVNTTEHALTYKQEKGSSFVSGTVVSPSKDGSRPVDDSDRNYIRNDKGRPLRSRGPIDEIRPAGSHDARSRKGVFAGTPGALATAPGKRPLAPEKIVSLLDKDLPLKTLAEVAFMFNFQLDILSIFKLCVQLSDGTGDSQYSSAWSQGFSLDSVGVNQIVSMPCKDGRALEVSMTLSVAPGLLSGYTKIVRFTPRFVLVNYLERPVRIWQDSSLLHPLYEGMDRVIAASDNKRSKWHFKDERDPTDAVNQYEYLFGRSAALDEGNIDGITAGTTANKSALYIATAGTSDVVPFHLPDTRGERQLRIDLGGSWNLTSSFSADATGVNIFKITRGVDSRLLHHVTTRASPQYRVVLPPQDGDDIDPWDGELGVWFETDWGGDRRIIVQGIKRESYAFNHTDIHIGDELLRVNDFNVSQMTFPETMKVLKEKLTIMSVDRKDSRPFLRASAIIMRRSKRNSADSSARDSSHPSRTKVVLTFRTLEERLRRVRIKALKARRVNAIRQDALAHPGEVPSLDTEDSETTDRRSEGGSDHLKSSSSMAVQVDMRMLQNSAFVIVRQPDMANPPFRIENRAMDHVVFFRQRSCNSYPWNQVMPGESLAYTWEEPLRVRKLVVRVGPSSAVIPVQSSVTPIDGESTSFQGTAVDAAPNEDRNGTSDSEMKKTRSKHLKHLLSARYVKNEEEGGLGASVSVKLEVIGSRDVLPCPRSGENVASGPDSEDYLNCYVDTDGITRVLVISDRRENEDEKKEMENHVEVLREQIQQEEVRNTRIKEMRHYVAGEGGATVSPRTSANVEDEEVKEVDPLPHSARREEDHGKQLSNASLPDMRSDSMRAQDDTVITKELQNLAEFPEDISITRCHQVYVEVIEAAGLRSSDASGMCNPYCEVFLKESSKSRKKTRRSKAKEKRMTYYIENTTAPKWATQVFIFDISPEAVHATRGYSVRVRLQNFHWIGNHPILGQTSVYLSALRNQREFVGWYPLVGTKERSDVDDSLGSYGRGSIKLRMQWIHSTPGLLDYFLMLSEQRLTNLHRSVVGMEEQLRHAIEEEKTREQYTDTIGSFQIPAALGLVARRKARMSAGHIRKESREGFDDLPAGIRKGKGKLPRPSIVFRMRDNLRKSREMHLWQLDSQTEESKRRRRSVSEARTSGVEPEEVALNAAEMQLRSIAEQGNLSIRPFYSQDSSKGETDTSESLGDAGGASMSGGDVTQLPHRGRAFSVPDARLSSQRRSLLDDDDESLNPDIIEFSRLVRSHSLGDSIVFDPNNNFLATESNTWQNQEDVAMEILFQRGFIHHRGDGEGFYHDHLAYHVRPILVDSSSSSANHRSTIQNFRAKSALRLSPVVREFRTWTAAQGVFNDNELETDVVNNAFYIKLKRSPGSSQIDDTEGALETTSFEGSVAECPSLTAVELKLPQSLPMAMVGRAKVHADELMNSRKRFERACKRSLRAVLNPGGWLTIRPMTALYLPETCTGMFVKLRYGTEVVVSETVDAKVSPTWTADTSVPVTSYAHTVSSSGSQKNMFEYGPSDLQVFIDPQRTSGSLRLSVVGERLNKSKVELGVLEIPLGAAINCCVECMEEIHEDEGGKHKSLHGSDVPAYVRWFPLMNPKEVVAVDGDLGQSSRPFESEQMRDNMFVQYFTPCIKLAFIWQPDEDNGGDGSESGNKEKRMLGENAVSESPVAETYCNADIGRVSFALIDSQKARELLCLYVTDIDIRYSVTLARTTTGLFLGCIQIDYQDDSAREPVVLAPTPGDTSQPTLQFVAVKDNLRSKTNITSYEYIWFALQEMDLTLEEPWMFELWEFFMNIIRRLDMRNMTTFGTRGASDEEWAILARTSPRGSLVEEHSPEPTLATLLEDNVPTNVGDKKMYVGQLLLGNVRINLSYLKGKKQNWEVNERGGITLSPGGGLNMTGITIGAGGMIVGRHAGESMSPTYQRWSERTQDEDLWTEADVKYSNLPKTIASVFPSVSDAPIRLQAKGIEHVFESPDEIFNSIKSYYQNEILNQIYRIIGALDFVGNPSMVFSSFLSGVRDFFVTPSQAFLRSPSDPSRVGMGVAKGTLSLFSHSASGVFGFVSKVSASAGQVVAVLSLDDEFKVWHRDVIVAEAKGLNRQWKRRGVQSVPTMVARPLYDVLRGLALGATGIVVNPYRGAKKRGAAGFAKGVAAGTIGIIAKPVVGVFDAFSHASGSVYDVAKSVNVLEKRHLPPKKLRLSYSFGPKGVLMPFDQVTARSVYLLETHPMKVSYEKAENIRAMGNEIHVASEVLPMEPGVETYVVASSHRIVLFQVKKESGGELGTNVRWQVDLTSASSISCKLQDQGHNGLALIMTATSTAPKKKVRIARPMSPEKRGGTPKWNATPIQDEHPHSSLNDTTSQVSMPLTQYEDDDGQHVSDLLGTDVLEVETLTGAKREFEPDNGFHGSVAGKDGEVVEWYTILAEYQQGRQLRRIHNAICCIIGDFDAVVSYRSGNTEGSTEGYTSFGELFFGESPLIESLSTTPRYDKAVCEDLNKLPWMYGSMFQAFKDQAPEKQQKMLADMRNTWLLSREVSAALKDGAPEGVVDTRARSTFIPHAPPALPASIDDGDDVVSEILSELKQGNISYDQACDLIASHEESVMVCPTPEDVASEVSSVTAGHDAALDQLFRSAIEREQSDLDEFHSAKRNFSSFRTPSDVRFLDPNDRTPSQTASTPGDFHASRSSLPFLDAMDSGELQSLAEKSLELQSLTGKSLRSAPLPEADGLVHTGASTMSLPFNASSGARESVYHSARGQVPLRQRTESAPAGLVIPKTPRAFGVMSQMPEKTIDLAPSAYDSWVSQPENPPDHSRLSRMESLLEHLIIMNARQLGQKQGGYQTSRAREEPDMIALREEIASLRSQVQAATTDGSRTEMIAALRKEVKLLKEELQLEKRKEKRHTETNHVDSQGVGEDTATSDVRTAANESVVGTTFDDKLGKVRPAAVQFARGLERRGTSMARRLQNTPAARSLEIGSAIPEEGEDDDKDRDVASV